MTDAIRTLRHLFAGGPAPACDDAADANDSGGLDLTDAVFLLQYLYAGGETPPAPGPRDPGPDATEDGLGCSA